MENDILSAWATGIMKGDAETIELTEEKLYSRFYIDCNKSRSGDILVLVFDPSLVGKAGELKKGEVVCVSGTPSVQENGLVIIMREFNRIKDAKKRVIE